MNNSKPLSIFVLGIAALFFAGCHSNQATTGQPATSADNGTSTATGTDQSQPAAQDETSANLVPVANTTTGTNSAAGNSSDYGSANNAPADDSADETAYGVQPDYTAPQPPPEIPQYDQPPCPEDGDIWTPGYWGWASSGYYWVPGAWVQAPYQSALWTPGYWGYSHNHYAYFRGYWGPHIGFYGGVNYGFGYTGVGYQGGYWNSGHFLYNRSVNNVNVTVVHNVYSRTIINNYTTNSRVSFNGGSGGIQVRPRLTELAALREPHAPPMQAQLQIRVAASQNRAQFVAVNHGRPQTFVETRAVVADHDVHPAVIRTLHNLPEAARPAPMEANRAPAPANHVEPNGAAPGHPEAARPEAAHPEAARPGEPNRPVAKPEPSRPEAGHAAPNRPEAKPEPSRPEPGHAAPNRPEPSHAAPSRPEPNHAETHPAPEHKPAPAEHKPAPEHKEAPKKPAPEHRPDPQV